MVMGIQRQGYSLPLFRLVDRLLCSPRPFWEKVKLLPQNTLHLQQEIWFWLIICEFILSFKGFNGFLQFSQRFEKGNDLKSAELEKKKLTI